MKGSSSLRERRHRDKTFQLGADELFYESNLEYYEPTGELRSIVDGMLASDGKDCWRRHRSGVWTHVFRVDDKTIPFPLPSQGWKIHVSATNANCADILGLTAPIALASQVHFKFANDTSTLIMMTSKRWSRGGSGKFITLYPSSERCFRVIIEEIYEALKGLEGSYILSDRRYRDSRCVYYRYGGFTSNKRVNFLGVGEEVLVSPTGLELRDVRNPYFEIPPWVSDPFPDTEEGVDDDVVTLKNGRYAIQKALSFSNTGGVYLATDHETGHKVVIKEARPHVELAADGSDAVIRLKDEERILRSLGGLGIVPEVYDSFEDWENRYLVIEFLDAASLRETMLTNSPLIFVNSSKEKSRLYYEKYVVVFKSLISSVQELHRRGLVVGDMSPVNIMVDRTTDRVRLIDFEGAFYPSTDSVKKLHTPGFRKRQDDPTMTDHFAADRYAVGMIMLYCMFPFSAMSFLRTDLFTRILPTLLEDIGWSKTPLLGMIRGLVDDTLTLAEAVGCLDAKVEVSAPLGMQRRPLIGLHSSLPLDAAERVLWDFLQANHRSSRNLSLFPIDPFGKETNPLGLGFGAAGIFYALGQAGRKLPESAETRYRDEMRTIDPNKLAPGLLVGSAGMAWERFAAGDVEAGARFLASANTSGLRHAHHSLYHGAAGIGMANLAAFRRTETRSYVDMAMTYGDMLARTAIETDRGICWKDDAAIRLGLGYGQSGVALFLLRLSQVLGESRWEDLGRRALEYDLSWAGQLENGVKTFPAATDIEHTYESYIEEGTSGIAKVAIRYGLCDEVSHLVLDAHRKYSGFSGLLFGLAGFVDVLVDAYLYFNDKRFLEMAERPLEGLLDFYVFESKNGYAVPGDGLFRISCDFATGVAGVAYALHRRVSLSADDLCLDEIDSDGDVN